MRCPLSSQAAVKKKDGVGWAIREYKDLQNDEGNKCNADASSVQSMYNECVEEGRKVKRGGGGQMRKYNDISIKK